MAEADLSGRAIESPGRTYWGARPRWFEGALLGLGVAEFAALSTFIAIAAVASFYHEPWSDEAQAWLIARDLSLPRIFGIMTYEGSPPLWHLLLKALIWLHLPYGALGAVSVTLMSGAMYVWLRWSPLPPLLRLTMPSAFYFQYQYAVVARSYALSIFLAFAAAVVWREGVKRIMLLAVILALLVQTNLYGFVMAAGFALAFACEYWRELKGEAWRCCKFEITIALIVLAASFLVAAALAKPPVDSSSAAGTTLNTETKTASVLSGASRALSGGEALYMSLGVSASWKLAAIILLVVWAVGIENRIHYGLLLVFTALTLWQVTLLALVWKTALMLLLLFWFQQVGKLHCTLPLLFTMASMGLIWARYQHFGMALAALTISLWIAWPERSLTRRSGNTVMLQAALGLALVLQLPSTLSAVVHEVKEPYSGAAAAAEYIRPLLGKRPIYGFTFFPVALQPYFEHNIYANQTETPWIWSKGYEKNVNAPLQAHMEDDAMAVVISAGSTPTGPMVHPMETMLSRQQMRRTRAFCGRLFWFDIQSEFQCFDIYEKQR